MMQANQLVTILILGVLQGCGLTVGDTHQPRVVLPAHTHKAAVTIQNADDADWNLACVRAPGRTDLSDKLARVTVAILDTGVDAEHPELRGRLEKTVDLIGEDRYDIGNRQHDFAGKDGNGHGTHVASIVTRLAPVEAVRVLPVKIIGHAGTGNDRVLARGIEQAIAWRGKPNTRVRILNLSVASEVLSSALQRAITKACQANLLVVVSAGNGAGKVDFPASMPEVLTVGATTQQDRFAEYSSFGDAVDLCAPGGDAQHPIEAGWPRYLTASDFSDGTLRPHATQRLIGTSMAAPHVSAAAALIWAERPYLSAWQVRARLLALSDDLGPPGWDKHFGFGRLNVLKALKAISHDALD